MSTTHTFSAQELGNLPTYAEGQLPSYTKSGTGFRTGSLESLYDPRNQPGYSPYASGNRGDTPDYASLTRDAIARSGLDPGGTYARGYNPLSGDTGYQSTYQLVNGRWTPVQGYSTKNSYGQSLAQFGLGAAALFGGGALLAAYGGAGAGAGTTVGTGGSAGATGATGLSAGTSGL